ncbi:hypothetical protein BHE74_00053095 [Ensete ventricosum]|nr:hypothetical protein GW17_00012612 [Ensete ventricosum]RWW41424.1 hypothetical protein BHE74_00053095 [Ensete ventricosum]
MDLFSSPSMSQTRFSLPSGKAPYRVVRTVRQLTGMRTARYPAVILKSVVRSIEGEIRKRRRGRRRGETYLHQFPAPSVARGQRIVGGRFLLPARGEGSRRHPCSGGTFMANCTQK